MLHFREKINFLNQLEYVDKAVFLLAESSGMTIDEIIYLQYGDFVESISDYIVGESLCPCLISELFDHMQSLEYMVGEWYITNPKTWEKRYAFNSSESTCSILDYLNFSRDPYISLKEPLFDCNYDDIFSRSDILRVFEEIDKHSEGCTD